MRLVFLRKTHLALPLWRIVTVTVNEEETMTQLAFIFDEALEESKAHARYRKFHEANPHVIETLSVLALRLKDRGHKHYGMQALFEVLRYETAMRTNDPSSQFKLNNDYAAFYARDVMRRYPELEGFFSIRRSVADE